MAREVLDAPRVAARARAGRVRGVPSRVRPGGCLRRDGRPTQVSSSPFPDDGKTRHPEGDGGEPARRDLPHRSRVPAQGALGRRPRGTGARPARTRSRPRSARRPPSGSSCCRADETIDLSAELEIASPAPFEGTGLTPRALELATRRARGRGRARARRDRPDREPALQRRGRGEPGAGAARAALASRSGRRAGRGPRRQGRRRPRRGNRQSRWIRARTGCAGATTRASAAEQTVVAVAGWQTQVFILEDALGPQESLRSKVSILMSKRSGFDPARRGPPAGRGGTRRRSPTSAR